MRSESRSVFFDSLNNVRNLYYFYSDKGENFTFKYIKMKDKIKIYTSFNEYKRILASSQIDIIYFQSLPVKYYRYFKYINPKTVVIWWCFGFEIYYPLRFLPPMVGVNLYKPITLEYIQSHERYPYLKKIIRSIYRLFRYPCDYVNRMKILKRIDYFSPVLPIDYEMMKKNPYFKAKPFMLNGGPGLFEDLHFSYYQYAQNILVGNSLTYTNNHLDIFDKIRHYKLTNQQYIIPINYGTDYGTNKIAFKELAKLPDESVIWLDDFVPFEKYKGVNADIDTLLKNIDIGGVALLRAAAKNYKNVTVICDANDYELDFDNIDEKTREELALKVYEHTSSYDYTIFEELSYNFGASNKESLPELKAIYLNKVSDLRYGENPHQKAALYSYDTQIDYEILNGKEMSYNNILICIRIIIWISRRASSVYKRFKFIIQQDCHRFTTQSSGSWNLCGISFIVANNSIV